MALMQNGFRDACAFQTFGATASNNAYPSSLWGNSHRTGANRNFRAGQGIISDVAAIPDGYRHPGAWVMPQKPGALSSFGSVTGSGGVTEADAWSVKLAYADMTGSGTISSAAAGLIVQLLADISGSGTVTSASMLALLSASADLSGSGDITDADLEGLAAIAAALSGSGEVTVTLTGIGGMSADILVTGDILTTANVGSSVWGALATLNNESGTMGEKLNDAGSASNPWTEVIESGYTAAEILRIIAAYAAGKTTIVDNGDGTATVSFVGLDGTTDRIVADMDGSERSSITYDGS